MKTIYKYELKQEHLQGVKMPIGAKVLSVGNQRNNLCLWALVDPEEKSKTDCIIQIFGTGHSYNPEEMDAMRFVGTVLLYGGDLVLHVFVERRCAFLGDS